MTRGGAAPRDSADEGALSGRAAPARVFLPEIVASRRAALGRLKAETPLPEMARRAAQAHRSPRPFAAALQSARPGRLAVIAEIKRVSPAKGALKAGLDPVALASTYARGGAAALSVLTEPEHFAAQTGDLERARQACGLPCLRKEFIVDPWQLYETAAMDADAVLLMVVVLGAETPRYVDLALELGIEPFVEVHTEAEMRIALATRARVVGINHRDLRTFEMDMGAARRLAPLAAGRTVAALSGIAGPDDLAGLAGRGVRAVLVGESLVRAGDPERAVRALVEATA
jgi:indole-3-glycerol phosphate synthase